MEDFQRKIPEDLLYGKLNGADFSFINVEVTQLKNRILQKSARSKGVLHKNKESPRIDANIRE
jgi:hypothetical protein